MKGIVWTLYVMFAQNTKQEYGWFVLSLAQYVNPTKHGLLLWMACSTNKNKRFWQNCVNAANIEYIKESNLIQFEMEVSIIGLQQRDRQADYILL